MHGKSKLSLRVVALTAALGGVAIGAEADRIQFHISPGPAQNALLQFSTQADLNINLSPEDLKGVYSKGVDGLMEPRGALLRLLDGTSLCSTITPAGKTVSVTRCSKPDQASSASLSTIPTPMVTVPVTSSNIHGGAPVGVNVVEISRGQFPSYGIYTTADLIARIPELAGANPLGPRAEGNSGLGTAVDLRGQGAGATLILLNGHRLAGSGVQGAFSDIANIPLSAIERVEIVLDGASAQYGSDAVGGAVNVITRTGDQQSEISGQIEEGLGSPFRQALLSLITSGDWDTGSAVASFEYVHATAWKGLNLLFPQTSATVDRIPGKELASGYLHLEQRLPLNTELTTEGVFTHRREAEQYDTPLRTDPIAAVNERTGVSVQMSYLSAESKTRVTSDGVLVISLNRATETERQQIYPTGAVEFIDGTTEDPSMANIGPTSFSMLSRSDQVSIKYDDSLWSYAAGKLKGALGGEYRCETFNELNIASATDFSGRYDRHGVATFGELYIPLAGQEWALPGVRELELSIAGRYERYSDFRGRYTPQSWLRWVPFRGVQLRGSWGRSSQAPNLPSLDMSRNAIFLAPVADNQSPTGLSDALVQAGNNSDLTGQTATTVSLGIRFDWPLAEKSFIGAELNSFRIHFYDRIQSGDLSQIQLSDPSYAPLVNRNLSVEQYHQLCSSPQFNGNVKDCQAAPIAAVVDLTLKNIDSLSTQGLNLRVNWGADFGAMSAGVDIRGIYFYQFTEKITPTAPAVPLLRSEKSPTQFQLSSLIYAKRGPAELDILVHCSSGFRDESTTPANDVPGWTTVDLLARYDVPNDFGSVVRNMAIVFSVRNIADRPLPVLKDASINQSYDFLSGLAVRRLLGLAFQKRL